MLKVIAVGILLVCLPPSFGQATAAASSEAAPVASVADAQKKLEHGQAQQAISELQQLASAHPPIKGANRELAIAYYRTGKLVDAESTFAVAMAEDPADIESVQMRGLTLYRLGKPAAAIPFLERVKQWAPNANADANYVLGLCYMNSQRFDEARASFAAQYGVDHASASAYLILGQMLFRANLPELASQNAQKALAMSPKIPLAHFLSGEIFLSRSDIAHALEQFELERAINPAYAPVYGRLGDVYTRMEEFQQAQESLTKAISLDQSSTGPFILMGKVFLRRNDPESAVMYLQHAEKMDPNNSITHTLLGQAYKGMGRDEDAKREIEVASRIHAASQLKLQSVE
jgi:tetratricopeptide (TPR) repeat protein